MNSPFNEKNGPNNNNQKSKIKFTKKSSKKKSTKQDEKQPLLSCSMFPKFQKLIIACGEYIQETGYRYQQKKYDAKDRGIYHFIHFLFFKHAGILPVFLAYFPLFYIFFPILFHLFYHLVNFFIKSGRTTVFWGVFCITFNFFSKKIRNFTNFDDFSSNLINNLVVFLHLFLVFIIFS